MGKRGPKKGATYAPTLQKAQQREAIRSVVAQHMHAMLEAQIKNALGLKYLVVRNAKTGKFEKVTKERMEALLESGDDETLEKLEIWDKDPSVQAFADLFNRAFDKPSEPEQTVNVTGSLDIVSILRARHAKHRDGQ